MVPVRVPWFATEWCGWGSVKLDEPVGIVVTDWLSFNLYKIAIEGKSAR